MKKLKCIFCANEFDNEEFESFKFHINRHIEYLEQKIKEAKNVIAKSFK